MSVYNGERFLKVAIESVLAQSMPAFELLILNDGSTDSSKAIIEGYTARDARVRAIHRENRGLVASLNELIEAAGAPWIARLDADDIAHPDRFARQLALVNAQKDIGVLGSWSRDIGADGRPVDRGGGDPPTGHAGIAAVMPQRNCICHPSVLMRRDVVRSVGGYHAAFRHCEDYDLWLRLLPKTRFANLPERLIDYRHSAEQVTQANFAELAYGTILAQHAYRRRRDGKPDPTESVSALPAPAELDAAFGEAGLRQRVLDDLYRRAAHSPPALRSTLFGEMIGHIGTGGARDGHWRTVARLLVRMNEPARAARLARALIAA